MDRRHFLRSTGLSLAAARLGRIPALAQTPTTASGWQTWEVTTHVEVLKPEGTTHIWLPLPLGTATEFQKPLGNHIDCPSGTAREEKAGVGLSLVHGKFPAGSASQLTVGQPSCHAQPRG